MKGTSKLKVEGGKLVKIDVNYDTHIQDIQIHGDFFIHPEYALREIEQVLFLCPMDDPKCMVEKIERTRKQIKAKFVGVSAQAIVEAIMLAKK